MTGQFQIHGGRLADARARFGGAAGDWLDLSTGINPVAWDSFRALPVDWRALPDPDALAGLERQAARHFGIDPAFCCAVPGSETGLRLIARDLALPGLHLPLCYSTHADAFEPSHPLTTHPRGPGEASALVLASPNNPDGRVIPRAQLLLMLARQEADGGWLIVDEAFADYRAGGSMCSRVAQGRRLIVLRSFGKFFGLAGLRLGFVIAPAEVLGRLRRRLGEWPIHAAALAFGTAAYADRDWIAATRSALPVHAARLDAMLRRHGLAPEGECPLFRLVRTPQAARIFSTLAHRHILTRPFAAHPHLLRFGLPADHAALARLDAALGHG